MAFWEGSPYLSLGSPKEMEIQSGLQSLGTCPPLQLSVKHVLLPSTQDQEKLQRSGNGRSEGYKKPQDTMGTWKGAGPEVPPSSGKRLGSPSARENQRLPGEQKSVQPFLGLPEASQVLRTESAEFQGPAASRRREGNPMLINLLANEAH